MHVQGNLRQLPRFQSAEMSSLVMYVPHTKLLIKESFVLARGETALFGGNGTQSFTSYNLDFSGRSTMMVLLISTCTWTCRKSCSCRNRENLVLKGCVIPTGWDNGTLQTRC